MADIKTLIAAYENEARVMSSSSMMKHIDAYGHMKKMGYKAVPPLLLALLDSPTPIAIIVLLEDITGIKHSGGTVEERIRVWRKWGKDNKLY
jgi:hypothetical protein